MRAIVRPGGRLLHDRKQGAPIKKPMHYRIGFRGLPGPDQVRPLQASSGKISWS
jgi:hypothetical protein